MGDSMDPERSIPHMTKAHLARALGSVFAGLAVLGFLGWPGTGTAAAAPAGAAPGRPAVRLATSSGPPTTSTSLEGRGFGSSETVDVTFDGTFLRHAATGPDGRFLTKTTIPGWALPGPHTVRAAGEVSGRAARAT